MLVTRRHGWIVVAKGRGLFGGFARRSRRRNSRRAWENRVEGDFKKGPPAKFLKSLLH